MIDTLEYQNDRKELSAIGTAFVAELYSSKIGDNTYFRITIDGDSYAVVTNPYGFRISSERYYAAWIWKNGKYESAPSLSHMAGSYFLSLPYAEANDNSLSNMAQDNNINTTTKTNKKQQIDWQLTGKVRVFSDARITRSGGEDDVVYDYDTAFLYSTFDGEKQKYKISIPKYGTQYDVFENDSYNGAKIQWDRHGKRVWNLPSLSEMFTHRAGRYYFNVSDVVR